jgi:hypothetical protein
MHHDIIAHIKQKQKKKEEEQEEKLILMNNENLVSPLYFLVLYTMNKIGNNFNREDMWMILRVF